MMERTTSRLKFCTKCGKELQPQWKFCPGCNYPTEYGTKTVEKTEPVITEPELRAEKEIPKTKPGTYIVLAIVFVIGIIIFFALPAIIVNIIGPQPVSLQTYVQFILDYFWLILLGSIATLLILFLIGISVASDFARPYRFTLVQWVAGASLFLVLLILFLMILFRFFIN